MKLDNELKALLPTLSANEYDNLEASLLADGCRDKLIVWKEQDLLIDGYNRYSICVRHNIPFDILERSFTSREEVKLWMLDNQLSRRNLTDTQRLYYAGMRYELEKKLIANPNGKNQYSNEVGAKVLPQPKTSERIAGELGVSHETIKNATKLKQAIDAIAEHSDEIKDALLREEIDILRTDLYAFGAVIKSEPEIGHAAIDEYIAGNTSAFKQAIAIARKEQKGTSKPTSEYTAFCAGFELASKFSDVNEAYQHWKQNR